MPKKPKPKLDVTPTKLAVTLAAHIVNDIHKMEKNLNVPADELVRKALLMFIATHSDFLGKKNGG